MTLDKRFYAPRGFKTKKLIWAFFFLLVFTLAGHAQMETMSADEVLKEADYLLNADHPDDAIPYMQAYLERTAGVEDARVRSMAQDIRCKLGRIFAQSGKMASGATMFETYINSRPALKWHEVMKMWSSTLYEIGNLNDCLRVTTNALAGPPDDVRAEIEEAAALAAAKAGDENEEDDDAGDGYEFDEYGEIVQKTSEESVPEEIHPSGYSEEDLLVLNMTLGEVYRDLGKGDLSIEPFTYVLKNTPDATRKGYAIMQVVQGLISAKDFDRLTELIPQLYRTDARYDIRVNIALMKAASALYDAGQYDNALPLFRMILPRDELLNYLSMKMLPIQVEAGIIPEGMSPTEFESIVEETLLGRKNVLVAKEETWVEEERINPDLNKPEELLELEELVRTIQGLPPYETEVLYRSAYLYDDVKRPWEAVRFFEYVLKEDPDSAIGKQAFYEVVRLLLDPLDQGAEAEERGFAFLNETREGLLPRQILYLLSGYYQQKGLMEKVLPLLSYVENFVPNTDRDILRYECELYYMQAVADMVLLKYSEAQGFFEKILKDYPASHQQENATYWRAVSIVFQQKYEEALPLLAAYISDYPAGAWNASAHFQSGICLFGMEKYDEAMAHFTTVIDRHPDSPVYPDALNLRGDIYGSKGALDKAIWDYQQAFSVARTPGQAKYAVFQMARVFEAEDRFDEILDVVGNYMDRYGDEADVAEGIYWIGKTKLKQGRVDEAVQSYFDAIVQYGGELEQGGVDSMIAELTRLSRTRLSETQRAQLKQNFEGVLQQSDDLTLQLRVRAMLAEMTGTRVELGRELIAELPDLDRAAPPVLAVMSDASFEMEDYSRANEILDVFLEKFSESEFMRPAFKLRAFDLYRQADYEAVLKLIAEAQARYGTDYDVAWAQLMKGEICTKTGRYSEACEALEDVFNVTGWRGETYAEAALLLGQAEEAAGNCLKAHGWYQRTYFQYKGYNAGLWAAEAYLGSARCLQKLGYTREARDTYRAMLFDKYVRDLPEADLAKETLGAEETSEIFVMIAAGVQTNLTITVEQEEGE